MICPACQHPDSQVLDSRVTKDGAAIRRRRRCKREGCEHRFTTYERVEMVLPTVVKRDQSRESFNRAKIRAGIEHACRKRPVPAVEIDRLVDAVELKLAEIGEREITSERIGEVVLDHLRDLDEVAYVRFASVYRSFPDVQTFIDELTQLLSEK